MTISNAQIERVVREVLADFGVVPGGKVAHPGSAASATPDETPKTQAQSTTPTDELTVTGRVVALDHVQGRLDRVRRLVVESGAVVTPSVRDELRRQGVTLSFGEAETSMAREGVRLILMAAGSSFDTESLSQGLRSEGVDVELRRADCLIRATDELAGELAGDSAEGQTRAVLITAYPAAAVCLANRHQGVRAVQGFDAQRIAADAASIGANLLVVDPGTIGPFLLKQIVRQFRSSGPVTCPGVYEERLG